MNTMQQGVITLLRSAITGEKLPLPEGFDLEAAYPALKPHHMDAMLYDGAVRCGISRQLPVMQTLFQHYCGALLVSEGQMGELAKLFAAFDENQIDYMPLKGSKMKALYPKPELRTMGDADILIRVEQYDDIVPIMESLGFVFKGESNHELNWQSGKLYVELHKRLIPSYNKDFYKYFETGWQMAQPQAGSRYTMSPEDEWIFQFTHFAKHFRDGGIGCRYVVDLWVYLRNHANLDQAYLIEKLEELRLLEFYDNIRALIAVWFGDAPGDEKTDALTDYIFASGSWGAQKSRVVSRGVCESKHLNGARGKLRYLRKTAFPGVEDLRGKYTILQKAPWTLPLVWLYRPFYKAFSQSGDIKRQMKNLEMLTTDNLQQHQQFLNAMGLDYHF